MSNPTKIRVQIEGMTCGKCVARVENALSSGGFGDAQVDLDSGFATLSAHFSQEPEITESIEAVGFEVVSFAEMEAPTSLRVGIEGMTCGKCVARVENALNAAGFADVEVDLDGGYADLSATPEQQSTVHEAIEDAGFEVVALEPEAPVQTPVELADLVPEIQFSSDLEFDVRGMTCASCVARVQDAITGLEGVEQASVNYASEVASIQLRSPEQAEAVSHAVLVAVEAAGYQATTRESAGSDELASTRRVNEALAWKRRWLTGLAVTVPLVLLQMGPMWFGWDLNQAAQDARNVGLFLMTAFVWSYVGYPFLLGAWRGLKHLHANMDTLVALGSSVAFLYSSVAVVLGRLGGVAHVDVYFDGAAMILTLISIGKWLETSSKASASRAMESLLDMKPSRALVKRGSEWAEIDASDLGPGDLVLVRNSDAFPSDGRVLKGTAKVDESMVTGESGLVERAVGDAVIGATVNQGQPVEVEITAEASHTVLAQIAARVDRAQQTKADVERLADKISGIFVPIVLVIALVTFVVWYLVTGVIATAVLPAVAVLVVACPCALGLATPTAMMVGMAESAKLGVLIRDANVLERASRIDVVVFDKTGTLTKGQPKVTKVTEFGMPDFDVLDLVWAVEETQAHPLAEAIVEYVARRTQKRSLLESAETVAGKGVEAIVDGMEVRIGRPDWLNVESNKAVQEAIARGASVVAVEVDGNVEMVMELEEEARPREHASDIVQGLRDKGVAVWMMSGDQQEAAEKVAAQVGISAPQVLGAMQPADKADRVRALQDEGHVVAMVGDGVNDAPVLATADLGIAMGAGTDLAKRSADITLMSDSVSGVRRAIEISEAIHRKIRQNLAWAFIYNIVLIPVAAFGYLQPAFAASAMALSSVSVVTNSLMIKGQAQKVRNA